MDLSTVQIVASAAITLVAWWTLRFFMFQHIYTHIPGPKATNWLKGNFRRFVTPDGWKFHEEFNRNYGGVARLDMPLRKSSLYVTDPLALHHICVKEQYTFEETDTFLAINKLRFGPSLLSSLGEAHKKQRKLLNPVFHIKHLRNLLPVFYPIAYRTREVIENEIRKGKEYVDVFYWISRGALEYIGQGGLGYTFDALDDQKTNAYAKSLQSSGPYLFRLAPILPLLPLLLKLGPAPFRRKIVNSIPSETVSTLSSIINTTEEQARNILQKRREAFQKGNEALAEKAGSGHDILSILMKANMNQDGEATVPEDELLGHMSTFIVAGHDTTSTATNRILHLLSQHPEKQARLRSGIIAAREQCGELDYDSLMGLPYLDAVCRETLRLYPPIPYLDRTCRKDTVLPLRWSMKSADGKMEIKEIYVKKGTNIVIGILGANRSKAIWGEDADEWKPDRWLQPLPRSVDEAHLPGVYSQMKVFQLSFKMMTFLGGGRACIGFKFSELEMSEYKPGFPAHGWFLKDSKEVVLSVLLEKLVFEPGPEIVWAMGGITTPVVTETGRRGQVPLKVSLVRK